MIEKFTSRFVATIQEVLRNEIRTDVEVGVCRKVTYFEKENATDGIIKQCGLVEDLRNYYIRNGQYRRLVVIPYIISIIERQSRVKNKIKEKDSIITTNYTIF